MKWEKSQAKRVCDECFEGDLPAMDEHAERYLKDGHSAVRDLGESFRAIVLKQNREEWWKRALKAVKGELQRYSDEISPEKNMKEEMPIKFQVLKKNSLDLNETYAKVNKVAKELRTFLCKSDIQKELRECHKIGASSTEIQEILRQKATELGFESEKKGLFKEYLTSSLRPDYYLPIDDTGIILEVERGKILANNMDLLDLWKCHICKCARYLFLIVPQERTDKKGKRTKQFLPVSNRLKTFFEPDNYVNVDAVFLFGY